MFGVPSSATSALVKALLVGGVHAVHRLRDLAVDVRDRARHSLAGEALAAVAQLRRLELPRGRAGGNGCVPAGAGAQRHVDLHGRVSTAVQDLARVDCVDLAQRYPVAVEEVDVLVLDSLQSGTT